MTDRDRDRSQPQSQYYRLDPVGGYKGQPPYKGQGQGGPSASKVLAILTALPVGGGLLALSGITLVATLIGLAVATPVFILFSPVLVPAALLIGFAVCSFLASGAMGITGLSSLSWVARCIGVEGPEQFDQAKKRMQDMAGFVGHKTKQVGDELQKKAQEGSDRNK